MSHKLKILDYLRTKLQNAPLTVISYLDDSVFEEATLSQKLITSSLPEQLEEWCRRPAALRKIVRTPIQELKDRATAMRRARLYYWLCISLLGHQPNSDRITSIFAGKKPSARKILESTDPDVVKLRSYLATVLVVEELDIRDRLVTFRSAGFSPQATREFLAAEDRLGNWLQFKDSEP